MTKIYFTLLVLLIIFSCKTAQNATIENYGEPTEAKEKAFLAVVDKIDPYNKCIVCHQFHFESVGPSFSEIAKVYKEKGGDLTKFLKGNAKAIVLPERFAEMQANLEVTKRLSEEDLKALTDYIRSFGPK
jgi:cytochrome c